MIKMSVKKGILLIVILAVLAGEAVFLNNIFGYLPVFAVAAAVIFSRVYLGRLKAALKFSEDSDLADCIRGERIDFKVNVENGSRLVFPRLEAYFYTSDLFGEVEALTKDTITLAPKEKKDFGFDIRFDHIGVYAAGLKRVVIYDLMGLFTCTYENSNTYKVAVIPKLYELNTLEVSDQVYSQNDQSLVPVMMEGNDYMGVREYVIGDPIKFIHWKLSARTEGYLTRQYENNTNTGLCTVLDFYAPEYDSETLMTIFDTVVETGLAVHNYAMNHSMDAEIKFINRDGSKSRIVDHQRKLMAEYILQMPRIHTDPSLGKGIDLLQEEGNSMYSLGNLAIVTADVTADLIEALIRIKSRRKNPLLFAVIPEDMERTGKEKMTRSLRALDGAGVYYRILAHASELGGGVSAS